MNIEYTNGTDARFIRLCQQLDFFLQKLIGTDKQKTQYARYNALTDIHDVVLIIDEGEVVGCGAVKQYEEHTMEMKRVFVKEECRGKGYGRVIVETLESLAKNKKMTRLVLEMGVLLITAQKMYKSCGFGIIENYDQYKGLEDSICMSKEI